MHVACVAYSLYTRMTLLRHTHYYARGSAVKTLGKRTVAVTLALSWLPIYNPSLVITCGFNVKEWKTRKEKPSIELLPRLIVLFSVFKEIWQDFPQNFLRSIDFNSFDCTFSYAYA